MLLLVPSQPTKHLHSLHSPVQLLTNNRFNRYYDNHSNVATIVAAITGHVRWAVVSQCRVANWSVTNRSFVPGVHCRNSRVQ
jgi:hypothetical protein